MFSRSLSISPNTPPRPTPPTSRKVHRQLRHKHQHKLLRSQSLLRKWCRYRKSLCPAQWYNLEENLMSSDNNKTNKTMKQKCSFNSSCFTSIPAYDHCHCKDIPNPNLTTSCCCCWRYRWCSCCSRSALVKSRSGLGSPYRLTISVEGAIKVTLLRGWVVLEESCSIIHPEFSPSSAALDTWHSSRGRLVCLWWGYLV